MDALEYLVKQHDHDEMSILEIKGFLRGWTACLDTHKPELVNDPYKLIYGMTLSQILVLKNHWMKTHRELPED